MHKVTRGALALVLLSLAFASTTLAADWPQFRGPQANGTAPDEGINKNWVQKPPAEMWRISLSDRGFTSPSVAAGKVFIIDHVEDNDVVRALDFSTGKELWQFTYADPGKEKYGFAKAAPTFADGKLYTFSRKGLLHCLDADSGQLIWSKDAVADLGGKVPDWHYSGSPVVDGDKLIIVHGGPEHNVIALNKDTGETLWTGGNADPISYPTPLIATIRGIRQYVVTTAGTIIGVDPDTGQVLWRAIWRARNPVNIADPVVVGDALFATTSYKLGCGLIDVTDEGGKVRWANKELQAHFNSPVLHEGHIYGIGDPGYLVCLDPETGDLRWKQPGFEKGGVVLVDGVVIAVNGKDGDVVMVEATPEAYKELGRIKPLGSRSWTPPVIANGKLLIRNTRALVCLDLM